MLHAFTAGSYEPNKDKPHGTIGWAFLLVRDLGPGSPYDKPFVIEAAASGKFLGSGSYEGSRYALRMASRMASTATSDVDDGNYEIMAVHMDDNALTADFTAAVAQECEGLRRKPSPDSSVDWFGDGIELVLGGAGTGKYAWPRGSEMFRKARQMADRAAGKAGQS